jgi:hypothetical protein
MKLMQQVPLFETDDPVVRQQQMLQQPAEKPKQGRFISLNEKMFADGGAVTEMNRLFQEGGMMQEGGTIDPVSGNEVPVGSMQEEVRDDIDAKLSEGEFVFPADVVRFIGLEKLMKIRDQAKQGLQRMDEMGQMGNAEEVGASANEMFEDDDNFESELDSVMSEVEAEEGATQEFAFGGLAGEDLAKAPKNPSIDTRYFKHADGRVMYIVFVNDKPSVKIPEGFEPMDGPVEQQVGKEAEEKAIAVGSGDAGGGSDASGGYNYYQAKEDSLVAQGKTRAEAQAIVFQEQSARNAKINNLLTKFVKNSIPFKAVQFVADKIATTTENVQMNSIANSIVSGETSISGSPFGSMSEAQAVANFGYGSDQHFDAIEATYASLPSSADASGGASASDAGAGMSSTSTDAGAVTTDSGVSVGYGGGYGGGGDSGGGGSSSSGVSATGGNASAGFGFGGWNKGGLVGKKKKKAAPKQTPKALAARR